MAIAKLPPETLRKHKGISFVGVATAYFCHDGKGNIFMAKRSKKARDEPGTWENGAGGLKWGFTLEDNVRREVQEEYNAVPKAIDFLGHREVFRHMLHGQPTHWLSMDFLVLVDRDQVKINEPEMFDDSGWFTLDNLPSPLHSQIERSVALNADALKKGLAP